MKKYSSTDKSIVVFFSKDILSFILKNLEL